MEVYMYWTSYTVCKIWLWTRSLSLTHWAWHQLHDNHFSNLDPITVLHVLILVRTPSGPLNYGSDLVCLQIKRWLNQMSQTVQTAECIYLWLLLRCRGDAEWLRTWALFVHICLLFVITLSHQVVHGYCTPRGSVLLVRRGRDPDSTL